ncbi:MAG: hypothetical protein JRS35_16560 [Deltaproteobacteria bacterium]|nr:hypothetical protein [Deltaproteobacteria bacterium]
MWKTGNLVVTIAALFAAPASAQFYRGGADLNADGGIGISDFGLFSQCFGEGTFPPPTEGFLGFSTEVLPADRGLLSMNSACVATFGQDARMCFTTDFIGQAIPLGITGEGWIQPVLLHALTSGDQPVDIATASSIMGSCGAWRSIGLSGHTDGYGTKLRLQGAGGFNGPITTGCSLTYPVSCCR